jgi:ribonuclease inhibitor
MIIYINGSKINSEADFHIQLEKSLGLSYYGRNLDALWDTLSGGVERPLTLIWKDASTSRERLGAKFDLILKILEEAKVEDESFRWDERFTYSLE